jgi:hypothetical protein
MVLLSRLPDTSQVNYGAYSPGYGQDEMSLPALFRDVIRYRYPTAVLCELNAKDSIMRKDNLLLASLSSDNRKSLMAGCTPVELPLKTLL